MGKIDVDISCNRPDDHHICIYAKDKKFIDMLESLVMNGVDDD